MGLCGPDPPGSPRGFGVWGQPLRHLQRADGVPGSEPSCSRRARALGEAPVRCRLQDHRHQPAGSSADPQRFQPQPGGDPEGRGSLGVPVAGEGWCGVVGGDVWSLEGLWVLSWAWLVPGKICCPSLSWSTEEFAWQSCPGMGTLLPRGTGGEAASTPSARGHQDLGSRGCRRQRLTGSFVLAEL